MGLIRTRPVLIVLSLLLMSYGSVAGTAGAQATNGRTTGAEDLSVSISGPYFDRGSDIVITVTTSDLNTRSEYALEWNVCQAYSEGASHRCNWYADEMREGFASGGVELGSGNMVTISTMTFTDPGLPSSEYNSTTGNYEERPGLFNNSYLIEVVLTLNGVRIATSNSDAFVLGGRASSPLIHHGSSTGTPLPNVLAGDVVQFRGRFYLDHHNNNVLDYTIDCDLVENATGTIVDSASRASTPNRDTRIFHTFEGSGADQLTSSAVSGEHYVECTLTRDVDSQFLANVTSNIFLVVDADVTGNEEVRIGALSSTYYNRTNASATHDILFDVHLEGLYQGTSYTADWVVCVATRQGDGYRCNGAGSYPDEGVASGNATFQGTATGTHSLAMTFTDPGETQWDASTGMQDIGLRNQSYVIEVVLTVSGVRLHDNTSDGFVLGGRVTYTQIHHGTSSGTPFPNILTEDDLEFRAWFHLDHHNNLILDYTVRCDLIENGTGTIVDSTNRSISTNRDTRILFDGMSGVQLRSNITAGEHYVECSLTRDVDSQFMSSVTSNIFLVVDANVTRVEEVRIGALSSPYYNRTNGSVTHDIMFDVHLEGLYQGTDYVIEWVVCNARSHGSAHRCDGEADPFREGFASGNATFQGTATGIHALAMTFTDPGMAGAHPGLSNNSYLIETVLSVSTVHLHENVSDGFVLGGSIPGVMSLDHVQNILKERDVSLSGSFYLDHWNELVLDYTVRCDLIENATEAVVDSVSGTYAPNRDHGVDFSFDDTMADGLTPLATLGAPPWSVEHVVHCMVIRDADGFVLSNVTSNVFEALDDTPRDDAEVAAIILMHPTEHWATVTITASELDPGQIYTLDWVVTNQSSATGTIMTEGERTWVSGNSGAMIHTLRFNDLADTSNACISIALLAGVTELQSVSNICWPSASTADGDGDGVYDKVDLCPGTPPGVTTQPDGCLDSDGDGFDTILELSCGSDPFLATSIPADLDSDQICDALDPDVDGDGFLDLDEVAAGTDPLDRTSFPVNRLPECSVYFTLEMDGVPLTFTGEAAIPALSGTTAQAAMATSSIPVISVPPGNYYLTAHCVDPDGDDLNLTVNNVSMGPVSGEISVSALIEVAQNVSETVEVMITWSDGTDTLTATVMVELDGDMLPVLPPTPSSGGSMPGFGAFATLAMLGLAGLQRTRRVSELEMEKGSE